MIFDYKPKLLHEHSAINFVSDCLKSSRSNLLKGEDVNSFDIPIGSIVSCLASSHKLDYMKLIEEKDSKQIKIKEVIEAKLQRRHKQAIKSYQSASDRDEIDGLRPYQFINSYLEGSTILNNRQETKAKDFARGLDEAFALVSSELTLKVGQRLYRGLTITKSELLKYITAEEEETEIEHKGFMSTTLSESVASAFSALSYSLKLRKNSDNLSDLITDLAHLTMILTNRRKGLPFVTPDALRQPNRNQGQLEVLLPRGLKILPTHFELDGLNARLYVDIV